MATHAARYFTELEVGETPRTETELTATVWRGIAALIGARIEDGSFGAKYPETCDDGGWTNRHE